MCQNGSVSAFDAVQKSVKGKSRPEGSIYYEEICIIFSLTLLRNPVPETRFGAKPRRSSKKETFLTRCVIPRKTNKFKKTTKRSTIVLMNVP